MERVDRFGDVVLRATVPPRPQQQRATSASVLNTPASDTLYVPSVCTTPPASAVNTPGLLGPLQPATPPPIARTVQTPASPHIETDPLCIPQMVLSPVARNTSADTLRQSSLLSESTATQGPPPLVGDRRRSDISSMEGSSYSVGHDTLADSWAERRSSSRRVSDMSAVRTQSEMADMLLQLDRRASDISIEVDVSLLDVSSPKRDELAMSQTSSARMDMMSACPSSPCGVGRVDSRSTHTALSSSSMASPAHNHARRTSLDGKHKTTTDENNGGVYAINDEELNEMMANVEKNHTRKLHAEMMKQQMAQSTDSNPNTAKC